MNGRPLVIYHDCCADGFGAAFAAWVKLGDSADYMPASYGDQINAPDWIDLVDGRDVYILDFSFPKPVMELALAYANNLVWLDHHKTAFEMWCGKYEKDMKAVQFEYVLPPDDAYGAMSTPCHIELDDTRSGATIAWNYFQPHKEAVPLIQHIDDYDRWQFKLANTKAINKAMWSYTPWSFAQWNVWVNDWELLHGQDMVTEGLAILRAHDQKVKQVIEHCARPINIPIPGFVLRGVAANCPPDLASDVGHHLAVESDTFGLTWHQGKGDNIKCSLRSNGDYDVAKIAAMFGGGGHRNAAGFHTTLQRLQSWIINDEKEEA